MKKYGRSKLCYRHELKLFGLSKNHTFHNEKKYEKKRKNNIIFFIKLLKCDFLVHAALLEEFLI